MIRSMTAFARMRTSIRRDSWVAEFRSVNHRFFEFSVKLPSAYYVLETRIRDLVQKKNSRGKIFLALSPETGEENPEVLKLNEPVVRMYLEAIQKLEKRSRVGREHFIGGLLTLPKVFKIEKREEDPEKDWPLLKRLIDGTLDKAVAAKEKEGRQLAKDVSLRLRHIGQALAQIRTLTANNHERYFKRLSDRLAEILAGKETDSERIYREAAFLAERADITEEMVRLQSHLDLFSSRLEQGTEVGRELDFLCQEMNREINTLGSKAQLFEVSTQVVGMKGELEKIREQIQNIE